MLVFSKFGERLLLVTDKFSLNVADSRQRERNSLAHLQPAWRGNFKTNLLKNKKQMQPKLPHTIETITGEKLTFVGITRKDGKEFLEAVNEVQPNAGPPMHTHFLQDESLTVVSGKIGYQELGGEPKFAGPGETVLFKAGVPHKFWNAGTDTLHCTGYISPANNIVYFLSEIYRSMNENGGRPAAYDAAFLLSRYKSEFAMLDIPPFVQKVIFPIALFFGNLTGKNRKFADAPPPK